MNETFRSDVDTTDSKGKHNLIDNNFIQASFCVAYTIIFIVGIVGNLLVCLVVFRNKSMRTVTNLFITNLALSDILLCVFAVPFTPLYSFMGSWYFGSALCHIMPFAQGCSVYISTLTLTSIAIDRFFVIIYPFRPRMKIETCIGIILFIWVFSITITMPYAVFMQLINGRHCDEAWPSENFRRIFGTITSIMQFVLPFVVIAICYTCVSFKLNDRAKSKPSTKNNRREELDRSRKRRTNQMLIAMVSIFGMSWLPLNVINICNDYHELTLLWDYYFVSFFLAHLLAMSSTCYNPLIYAWLNENFRKEFKQLIPCLRDNLPKRSSIQLNHLAGITEKTFNGTLDKNDDSYVGLGLLTSSSMRRRDSFDALSDDDNQDMIINVDVKHCHISTSYNLRRESVKLRLINEESFENQSH